MQLRAVWSPAWTDYGNQRLFTGVRVGMTHPAAGLRRHRLLLMAAIAVFVVTAATAFLIDRSPPQRPSPDPTRPLERAGNGMSEGERQRFIRLGSCNFRCLASSSTPPSNPPKAIAPVARRAAPCRATSHGPRRHPPPPRREIQSAVWAHLCGERRRSRDVRRGSRSVRRDPLPGAPVRRPAVGLLLPLGGGEAPLPRRANTPRRWWAHRHRGRSCDRLGNGTRVHEDTRG